ncbi:MAG TPA: SusC/RagA family TonB-linked outer membrane protein [Bacteroidales bacterium]|nr:SusC/RagA family TonB-linked outer membrane protein [Bacteroidales bacterium]
MGKSTLFIMLLLFTGMQALHAQKTISGKITSSEDGSPIPGATVVVKGTTIGTTSSADGTFQLEVPDYARILVFSFVGRITRDIELGTAEEFNVILEPDIMDIEGVVVTALGISREKKALGYSVQDIKGEDLEAAKENNIVNSLAGKVAGVQIINASGAVGSSSRITIRGNSSFGNNQPLFIVDGVPVSNYSSTVSQYGGVDWGNAIMDIDPANIESMSVLKGANAAALYGARAASGVILITTKSGNKSTSKGISVSFTTAYQMDNLAYLPLYQDKYGQGYAGDESFAIESGIDPTDIAAYEAWARENSFSYYDGAFGGVIDGIDESWGPRLDIGLNIPQFDSPLTDPRDPDTRTATPWISHPDNLKDFYQPGGTWDNNLSFAAASDKASGRLSLSSQNTTGTIPNTDMDKYTVHFSGTMNITKRFKAGAIITYVQNHSDNLPTGGYGGLMSPLSNWFGRQVDMKSLKDHWQELDVWGNPYNWNSLWNDNPYWTTGKNTNSRTRDRIFGNFNLTYQFTDWLSVTGRVGTDWYNEYRKAVRYNNPATLPEGAFSQSQRYENITYMDLILTADRELGEDFGLRVSLGADYSDRKFHSMSETATALTVPDLFTIANVKGTPSVTMYDSHGRENSVFGTLNLNFRRMLYLDITGRNDWSSTLPKDNWSYFYPSFGLSWVFTEAFDIPQNILTFGKIRGSWAQVGNATDPYQLTPTYAADPATFNGVACYYFTETMPPLDLKPEKTASLEVGTDLKFFNNRLGVDYTYYDKTTKNQILGVQVSSATGFADMLLNAGVIRNWGHELMVTGVALKSMKGLNWEITLNWSRNQNRIEELYGDLTTYYLSYAWGVTLEAPAPKKDENGDIVEYYPWGVIRGGGFVRDDHGNIVVGEDGIPKYTDTPVDIGHAMPDWFGGLRNAFHWKDLSLSFLIDFRKGGDIFSLTDWFGAYTGTSKETAEDIDGDHVMPAGDTYEIRRDGIIFDGVKEDGTKNDIIVSPFYFYKSYYPQFHESSVIDGSFIKLREVLIDYWIPDEIMARTGFIKSCTLSLYGRNLALLWTHKSNDIRIDPEVGYGTTNDGVGVEQNQLPPTMSTGIKLSLTF